jgi:Glycosyltransferase family 87
MDSALARRDPTELIRRLWIRWRDPIWLGMTTVGILAIPYIIWSNQDLHTLVGFDAYATWALNFNNLYGIQYMDLAAFRYSPAYAQAFFWAHLLPWELFGALFIGASAFILWRWAGRWTIALIALPPVALELYHGNIHLFMAAAMVVGFRYPAAWAFPLLAKVTPGIAVLWFAGARQWRNLAIALGTTAVIAAISFVIAPQQWIEFARVNAAAFAYFDPPRPYPFPISFLIRAPIAAAIALWGGWTGRRWTVPVAATLALPIIWVHGLSMLLAIIPLAREDARNRARDRDREGERAPASPPSATPATATR